MSDEISCKMLKDAINDICPASNDASILRNIKVVEHEGNKFIALEAGEYTSLGDLAKKIVGESAAPAAPAKPVKKSKLENMSDQMGILPAELRRYLEENKLDDILKNEGVVGKADETIQISICSNYKGFASVLESPFEELLFNSPSDSVKKLFKVIRFLTDSKIETDGEINERKVYINNDLKKEYLKRNIGNLKLKDQEYKSILFSNLVKSKNIENGIKQNSELHKSSEGAQHFELTILVESQLSLCLSFLKRILLILYRDFEIKNERTYNVQNTANLKNDDIVNQQILNKKLDEIFGMKLTEYIDDTIDIIVDDEYAPNDISSGFSSWRISKNTKVFELISIIKSLSVYLRMLL